MKHGMTNCNYYTVGLLRGGGLEKLRKIGKFIFKSHVLRPLDTICHSVHYLLKTLTHLLTARRRTWDRSTGKKEQATANTSRNTQGQGSDSLVSA